MHTSTPRGNVIGPPPPYDAESAEYLAMLPELPQASFDRIAELRTALAQARTPADSDLALNGRYLIEEYCAPGPAGSPAVPLLVCRPASCHRPGPVLYFAHSGGRIAGTSRHGLLEAVHLAAQVGAAVISVEYRLAPEAPQLGPVEDCYAGLVWVVENAEKLHVDADQIVLLGGSAGGGLSAGLALMARDRGYPSLLGQLLICPMLDDRNNSVSTHQMAHDRIWNRADNDIAWRAVLGAAQGGPAVSPYVAPARADDLSNLPPTYIDVGSSDIFREEDIAYAMRIWRAGGVAELHVWPGGFHGFDALAPSARLSQAAISARITWLRRLIEVDPQTID